MLVRLALSRARLPSAAILPRGMAAGLRSGRRRPLARDSASLTSAAHPAGYSESASRMVIDSITGRSSGTPIWGSFTGTAAMASTTSVPSVTWPKMV